MKTAVRLPKANQEELENFNDSKLPVFARTWRRRFPAGNAVALKSPAPWPLVLVLILLDEPFAGVDPIAVIEIQRIVHFLKERGIGVLITDHNVRETLGICDHAYIISNGSVLAQGKPEAIVENPQVRNAYLGDNFTM